MSRAVFASLVKERLGADRGDSFLTPPAPRRKIKNLCHDAIHSPAP